MGPLSLELKRTEGDDEQIRNFRLPLRSNIYRSQERSVRVPVGGSFDHFIPPSDHRKFDVRVGRGFVSVDRRFSLDGDARASGRSFC